MYDFLQIESYGNGILNNAVPVSNSVSSLVMYLKLKYVFLHVLNSVRPASCLSCTTSRIIPGV